ncbi:MAG: hypothetical protein KDH20_03000, partial [Rhodocyclaceae bacterium]|nr:hypothetical protein [Rhodocyclaceae bacterium]
LTDPERQKLNRGTAAKVVEVFKRLPSGTEMASVALAGSAKRGWYRESARALLEVFGERDAPRFSALLAALSPQTSVESNLTNALRTWVTWTQYQRPTDRASIIKVLAESVQGGKGEESILPSWINNTVRALQAEDPANVVLSGPKVDSFRRNLNAEFEHVTNDAWMANYALVEQTLFSGSLTPTGTDPGKGPGYVAMSAMVRQAARELTKMTGEQWTPAEVQETVWSWAKAAYEMAEAAGETRSVRQIIEDQALTSDIINSVPDFAGLFNEGRYRQILEEAGYGPELARLERGADAARADRAGAAPAESGTAGETAAAAGSAAQAEALINPRHLQRAASRLDRLREARRSEDGPRFARERPLSKISEAYQEAADRRVWQPVAAFTTRILSKVKLANDTPPEFRRLVRQMRAKQQIAAEQAANVAKHGRELDPDLRKVVSDYIEGEMKVGTVPPQVVTDIATMMQVAHKAQGKRLVELGMLAPESHERLSGAGRYLARYYTKHILNNPFDRALRTTIRQGIQGDRLRGRGTFEPIKAGDWPQYKALGWQLRGMDDAEVRDLGRDTEIRVWRDWTKAEREKMGEIRDAVYRYTRGYMEASRDIAMGELFADMVERGIAKNSDPGGGYHQVPATQIPGTGVQRYGKLAGKWVPDAVWDDLKVIRPEDPGSARATLTRAYLKALALWKEGKTSLNPVVHGNNIVSNVIMADLAGISPWDGKAYYRAAKEYMRKGKLYREAQEAGLFGTEFYGQEIRQMLPELDQFRDIETASAGWFTKGVDYAYRYSGAKA